MLSGGISQLKEIIWFWFAVDYNGLKVEVTNCINRSRKNCVNIFLGGKSRKITWAGQVARMEIMRY